MNSSSLNFLGLRENPFNNDGDPRYFHLTPGTRESLAELEYGIQTRKGFLLLTGEAGTGKTVLLRQLYDRLIGNEIPTAFVLSSVLDDSSLLEVIFTEFGVSSNARLRGNALKSFHRRFLTRGRADDMAVLILDEAQGLPFQVLEDLRLLLNLETPGGNPIQVVFAGQPEFERRLREPELFQLRQRISVRCKTARLTQAETKSYILRRLAVAGATEESTLEDEAVNAVYFYSVGIPRVINLLCERALVRASACQLKRVPVRLIEAVASELEFDELSPRALSTYSRFASCANWMTGHSRGPALTSHRTEATEASLVEQPLLSMGRGSAVTDDTPPSFRADDQALPSELGSENLAVLRAPSRGAAIGADRQG